MPARLAGAYATQRQLGQSRCGRWVVITTRLLRMFVGVRHDFVRGQAYRCSV